MDECTDPEINPFAHIQAQPRAHRSGQEKRVLVYQLVTKCSMEEEILRRCRNKLTMANLAASKEMMKETAEEISTLLQEAGKILDEHDDAASSVEFTDEAIEKLLDRSISSTSVNNVGEEVPQVQGEGGGVLALPQAVEPVSLTTSGGGGFEHDEQDSRGGGDDDSAFQLLLQQVPDHELVASDEQQARGKRRRNVRAGGELADGDYAAPSSEGVHSLGSSESGLDSPITRDKRSKETQRSVRRARSLLMPQMTCLVDPQERSTDIPCLEPLSDNPHPGGSTSGYPHSEEASVNTDPGPGSGSGPGPSTSANVAPSTAASVSAPSLAPPVQPQTLISFPSTAGTAANVPGGSGSRSGSAEAREVVVPASGGSTSVPAEGAPAQLPVEGPPSRPIAVFNSFTTSVGIHPFSTPEVAAILCPPYVQSPAYTGPPPFFIPDGSSNAAPVTDSAAAFSTLQSQIRVWRTSGRRKANAPAAAGAPQVTQTPSGPTRGGVTVTLPTPSQFAAAGPAPPQAAAPLHPGNYTISPHPLPGQVSQPTTTNFSSAALPPPPPSELRDPAALHFPPSVLQHVDHSSNVSSSSPGALERGIPISNAPLPTHPVPPPVRPIATIAAAASSLPASHFLPSDSRPHDRASPADRPADHHHHLGRSLYSAPLESPASSSQPSTTMPEQQTISESPAPTIRRQRRKTSRKSNLSSTPVPPQAPVSQPSVLVAPRGLQSSVGTAAAAIAGPGPVVNNRNQNTAAGPSSSAFVDFSQRLEQEPQAPTTNIAHNTPRSSSRTPQTGGRRPLWVPSGDAGLLMRSQDHGGGGGTP